MHQVRITREGLRYLDRLPSKIRQAALTALWGSISENPHRVGKPLVAELAGPFSARRGDYRIIYGSDEDARVVTVHRIQPRRFAYRPR